MNVADNTDPRPDVPSDPSERGARWTGLLVAGAVAIVASILILELLVIQELVPPLVGVAVLLIVGMALLVRGGKAGVIMIGVVGLVYLVLLAPFVGEAFAFPASTLDFVINLVSISGALAVIIGAVATLRSGSEDARSPAVRSVGIVLLLVVVAGSAFSVFARLTREDPLGQPSDITITAEDTEYSPEEVELTGTAGDSLSFFIQNEDLTAHTFTIDELDVDEAIPGGGSARVELETVEGGTYEYYCSITGHEEMKGTIRLGSEV